MINGGFFVFSRELFRYESRGREDLARDGESNTVENQRSTQTPWRNKTFFCNNMKAKRLLGLSSKTNLGEGLKRTIHWYETHFFEQ